MTPDPSPPCWSEDARTVTVFVDASRATADVERYTTPFESARNCVPVGSVPVWTSTTTSTSSSAFVAAVRSPTPIARPHAVNGRTI